MTAVHSRHSTIDHGRLGSGLVGLDRAGGALRRRLFVGVCTAAIIAAGALPAMAGDFVANSEGTFDQAIANANASADPSSTIALTGGFNPTAALPAITSNITIDTSGNTVTLASGLPFDSIDGGTTLIDGGGKINLGTTHGGTASQLSIAHDVPGETATLTISGVGTVITATGTDAISIGGAGSTGTLNIEDGGTLNAASAPLKLYGTAVINVTGAGSTFNSATIAENVGTGTNSINVTDGGVLSSTNAVTFGGTSTFASGPAVNGTVSGDGSKLSAATTLFLQHGTLSVLDGANVTANAVVITNQAIGTGDFDALVSGAGSELDATTSFTLGTKGTGTLTIADGARWSSAAAR